MSRHRLAAAASIWSDAVDVDDSADRCYNPSSSIPIRLLRACTSSHPKPSHQHPTATRRSASSVVGDGMQLVSRPSARAAEADQAALDPWHRAFQFLGDDRTSQRLEIRRIRGDQTLLRAPLVVGTVTSSRPNGLGDFFLTLKDPTGTIGASVHKNVLSEGNIAEGISVGSVIVLKEVAVFHPSRSSCYINITKENVVKVLQKGCCPLSMVVTSSKTTENLSEKCTETRKVACLGESHIVKRDGTETYEGTAAIPSQEKQKNNCTTHPTNYQQRQGGGTLRYGGRNEAQSSTENIMRRLFGAERMMPGSEKGTVCEDTSGNTSIMDTDDWCSFENHQELVVHNLHQQALNTTNIRYAQPGLDGSSVLSGSVHSTQVSAFGNEMQYVDSERMPPSSKRLKSDSILPYGNGATMNDNINISKMDDDTNYDSEGTQNIEMDHIAEFNGESTSGRAANEHQTKCFGAPNAGGVQSTIEICTPAINATAMTGSLLSNPKKLVSVVPVAEWTDEQLSELFADY